MNASFKEVDRCNKRYVILKGSAGSGKSVDTAQNYILRLMKDKGRNLLCVRKSDVTNRDSTYAELTGAIYRMFGDKSDRYWKIKQSPLMLECINGNQIIFRGVNDDRQREKLKSITFQKGKLTDVWIEEATELTQSDFEIIDDRLRGELPEGQFYQIYHYVDRIEKGRKSIIKIQVWSDSETWYYVQDGTTGKIELDASVEYNPRPHVLYTDSKTGKKMGYGLGYIPFWRLDYNKKQISGLNSIKSLIDDYDIMQCGLSNNLADFDTPLHVVSGFQGDNLDELQTNLKTKKIIGVDSDGDVQVRTVDIPYQARKAKADEDEKNIYRFGMGFNSSQVGDGNITNIVILSRYTLLDLKANKFEKRLKRLLKQIVKVVIAEINKDNGTDYQVSDVYFDFKHSVMTNETENISNEKTKAEIKQIEVNTILNAAANIGDEQTLKALCDVMELDFDELESQIDKIREEQKYIDAKNALEGMNIE